MIVYANRKRRVKTQIRGESWRDALIRFGEVEAAIADSLCPAWDQPHPLLERLRSAAIRLAGGDMNVLTDAPPLPAEITVAVPEGYAYYGVYPEDYAAAARLFYRDVRPQKAVVIGIRSIGTSLSAVVAATLAAAGCEVRSFTVRPRGHPFDRQLSVRGFRLQADAHYLVVDEGPGLSGSSFCCVASHLSGNGIPDDRIILFPSWETDGKTLRSEMARQHWGRYRKYTQTRQPIPEARDLSAGQWRQLSPSAAPVHPQHERRKYLRDRCLFKFEGLGDYGTSKVARAEALWAAGFAPRPLALTDGYLATGWVEGRPLDATDTPIADWIARYLRFLETHFPSDRPVPYDENMEMISVNVREGLGPEWVSSLDRLKGFRAEVCDRSTTQIDGRILPHEFLLTAHGYVKTDTLDHHDDHFFPGCQDVAWDAAGASLEFRSVTLDTIASPACLTFYKVAYLSYRLGYCTMAAESASDVKGFRTLADQYRDTLRHELHRLCRS